MFHVEQYKYLNAARVAPMQMDSCSTWNNVPAAIYLLRVKLRAYQIAEFE
jgi:hypothetical protein